MHVKHTACDAGILKNKGQCIWGENLTKNHTEKKNKVANFEGSMPALVETCNAFSRNRKFDKHDSPRNLLLALICETGELAELLQWESDDLTELPTLLADRVAQELADMSIFFLRLTTTCQGFTPENTDGRR